jgi:hypothetical protein
MKTRVLGFVLFFAGVTFLCAASGPAEAKNWEDAFAEALIKGKEAAEQEGGGLGYTPSLEKVLDDAVAEALDRDGPPCQCMKIAISLEYSPYLVLKTIYRHANIEIDELCMCGTEQGILKEVIAKAAVDATLPSGEKVFAGDEVKQSQCLQTGLPYTAAAAELPDAPDPPDPVPPDSVAAP